METRRSESWKQRLKLLQSIHLDGIAAEINRARLRDYQSRLSCPTDEDRKNLRRLLALYDGGQLLDLPGDLRADGPRMRSVLIGLHLLIGDSREAVLSYKQISVASGMSYSSVRRGLDDLRDGMLVSSRTRERARWQGGEGPSAYFVVWSTLQDLSSDQGLQLGLAFEASQPVTAESDRPDIPSGRVEEAGPDPQECGPAFRLKRVAPQSREHPPAHREQAPAHREHPPAHSRERAGARFSPSPKEKEGDSFFEPPRQRIPPPPSFPSAVRARWLEIVARLAAYGLATANETARTAERRGWSIEQVHALLDFCEGMTVDGIRAFGPGLIHFYIETALPGTPVAAAPREEYIRAKRDRAIRLQADREAKANVATPPPVVTTCDQEWAELPEALRDELLQAVLEMGGPVFRHALQKYGTNSPMVAAACMAEYRRRSSAPK